MLNEMRFGALTNDTIAKFRNLDRRVTYNDGIEPTELYALLFCIHVLRKCSPDLGSLRGGRYTGPITVGSNNYQENQCRSRLLTSPGRTPRASSSS